MRGSAPAGLHTSLGASFGVEGRSRMGPQACLPDSAVGASPHNTNQARLLPSVSLTRPRTAAVPHPGQQQPHMADEETKALADAKKLLSIGL